MPLPQIKTLNMRRAISLMVLLFAGAFLAADPLGFFSGLAQKSQFDPTAATKKADSGERSRTAGAYGRLPLSFQSNQGQFDPPVRFKARGLNYNLFLTANEAVLALRSNKEERSAKEGGWLA